MGGAKQKSRHQQIVNQNKLITKLLDAWKDHIKHADPNHRLLTHDEIDEKLDGLIEESDAEHDRVFAEIARLTVEIRDLRFNALPFWKRWHRTFIASKVAAIRGPTTAAEDAPSLREPPTEVTTPAKPPEPAGEADSGVDADPDDTRPLPEEFVKQIVKGADDE